MANDTGNGASYTFSGVTVAARRITVNEQTLGNNPIDVLSDTTWIAKQPHDLGEQGTVAIEHLFDPSDTDQVPALGTQGTLTITFDQLVTSNTAANITGSAHISAVKPPDFANNETLVGTITFQWDGSGTNGPVYSAEA